MPLFWTGCDIFMENAYYGLLARQAIMEIFGCTFSSFVFFIVGKGARQAFYYEERFGG